MSGTAPLAGMLALWLAMLAWAWDFTVDDALISLRYAQHLAHGLGPRWNADGPLTDGVTPLPWPWLLAPLSFGSDLWAALERARLLSVLCASAAIAIAARELRRRGAPMWACTALLWPFPWAAWAVSGMESSAAALLLTAAACARPGLRAAALAGVATTLRPELLPAALVLAVGRAWQAQRALSRWRSRTGESSSAPAPWRGLVAVGLVAAAPFVGVALLRWWAFGAPAPLSVAAKPSDLAHGAAYALAATLSCGTPLLLAARGRRGQWPLAWALLTQLFVLVWVGGDWMPYARLWVPLLPLAVLWCDFRAKRTRWALLLSLACALGFGWRASASARGVLPARQAASAQIARAAPAVPIAALDIGFVAAAVGQGAVVDLGGLTDVEIAHLPGGLSSKRVTLGHLDARAVQSVLSWGEHGSRVVEQRLLRDPRFLRAFEGEPIGELAGRPLWLWRRRAVPWPEPPPASPWWREDDGAPASEGDDVAR